MNAKEARKLAHGKSYANKILPDALSSIKSEARAGRYSTSIGFTGPYAIDMDCYHRLTELLVELGYQVCTDNAPTLMYVSWYAET